MNYKYSHSLCSEIEIDISFYQFYRRFSIHYFCFFFPSKIFYASPKGSILYKTKDNISFFFFTSFNFLFPNKFIYRNSIRLFYIKRYHIFIRFSPSFLFHIIIQQNDLSIHKSIESFPSTSQILFAKYILTQCIVTNAIRNNSFAAVHRS